MLFYKLFLEKTSAHTFKRYYLIIAILISIGIPFITFTEYVLVEPENSISTTGYINKVAFDATRAKEQINYLPIIIWSIYVIGALLFSFRFFKNLYKIIHKIKTNPKFKNEKFVNVLLHDLIHPHTFFNYIFLNKNKYENNLIPNEVLLHEQVHAKQRHALDILFIEILQIVFWFNPLLHFIKKDIKLNHEFLADQAVINNGTSTKQYQQLLLAFSSNASHNQLVNTINYSLIKKRFTVMKTKTSKTKIWARSLALLPLLAILIFSFSSYKKVEKYVTSETSGINHTARSIEIEVFQNGTYKIDGISANKETFISTINNLHQDITPEIRNRIINIHVNNGKVVSDKEVWFIYNAVIDYGFHRIVTYNQEIIREKGNKPFAITSTVKQKGASKEQVAEYNKLAKKYNTQPENKRIIKLKDVKRLEYLYSLMTKEQKANAESFPNIPPPPEPPHIKKVEPSNIPPPPPPSPLTDSDKDLSPKLLKLKKEYEKVSNEYGKSISKYLKQKNGNTSELKEMYKNLMKLYKNYNTLAKKEDYLLPPPPPPAPKVREAKEISDNQTIDLSHIKNSNSPWKVTIGVNAMELNNMVLNDVNTLQKNASKKEIDEYNALAKNFKAKPENKRIIKLNDFSRIHQLYLKMSDHQKKIIEPFPSFLTPQKSDEQIVIDMIKNGAICYLDNQLVAPKKIIKLISDKKSLKVSSEIIEGENHLKFKSIM
ncbi:hypothetical protein GCM10023315_08830 [Algibacter aquimarinus]|uniref:Peptidase M56 domain-containing protein n=2 Tax=Algibacter aquimarinus TaxID=1136748 RepID=A0ABP9H766_9FLAO